MSTPGVQFWVNDVSVLLNRDAVTELFPTTSMCYEQKLNAITRLVILLTLLGYGLTFSLRILAVGVVTLLVVYALYVMRKQKMTKEYLQNGSMEGFQVQPSTEGKKPQPVNGSYVNPATLESVLKADFVQSSKKNPFSNVLLTDIGDEPERKAAPPSFNVEVDENITKNVKRAVQMMNPSIRNTNKQLFGDLWQQFELDQSNRMFYSTPNTKVTNDQGAFGQYLYGYMPSAKEDTPDGNMARYKDSSGGRWIDPS